MNSRNSGRENDALSGLQNKSLVERLTHANRRIADLEQAQRSLSLERDKLAAIVNTELESVVHQREEQELWTACRLDRLVSSLTLVQRRDAWLATIEKAGVGGAIASLYPHDGKDMDPVTILVRGSGGFGDMLYLSLVVRLLFNQFGRARIVVLHEHPDAHQVFSTNPYVLAVVSLQGDKHREFLQAAAAFDVFDLIADVRYVISYATPPLSRIPIEFLITAHSRAVQWQRYVRNDWPYLNNILAREAAVKGMSKYELLGYTGNLSASEFDAGDFFPSEALPKDITSKLQRLYITLHHGADRFMSGRDGLSTKNLPDSTWADIVSRCRAAGITTVQVGEAREPLVDGVDVDLRGKSSFSQTATILKYSSAHVDTEGGLVHLARSMGTKAVVAFGPTPVQFFGYAGNINIQPNDCGNCWWISSNWARRCPLGMAKPACMTSHVGSTLAKAAIDLAQHTKTVSLAVNHIPSGVLAAISEFIRQKSSHGELSRGLVVSDTKLLKGTYLQSLATLESSLSLAVPEQMFADIAEQTTSLELVPFSFGHIPISTDSADWALVDLQDVGGDVRVQVIHDVIRILKAGSIAFIPLDATEVAQEVTYLCTQLTKMIGAKLTVVTEEMASSWADASPTHYLTLRIVPPQALKPDTPFSKVL